LPLFAQKLPENCLFFLKNCQIIAFLSKISRKWPFFLEIDKKLLCFLEKLQKNDFFFQKFPNDNCLKI